MWTLNSSSSAVETIRFKKLRLLLPLMMLMIVMMMMMMMLRNNDSNNTFYTQKMVIIDISRSCGTKLFIVFFLSFVADIGRRHIEARPPH